MKTSAVLAAVAVAASLVTGAPAAAAPGGSPRSAASGEIIIEGLTLAGTQYGTPSGLPTTVATDPAAIPVTAGDTFTYSTITCASDFPPWNRQGLHFDPDYPGITDPASVRHEITGTITQAHGDRGKVEGTITTYLCEGGVRTDQIVTTYKARFETTSANQIVLEGGGPVPATGGLALDGRFKIVGGTGRFEDLSGRGTMTALLTCLPATLTRNTESTCTDLGGFSEAPFQLRGSYRDPTAPTP